jgi:hypothetical protein
MNVITVSREYGAGGGEVAQRIAQLLGWELLDRELLHQTEAPMLRVNGGFPWENNTAGYRTGSGDW